MNGLPTVNRRSDVRFEGEGVAIGILEPGHTTATRTGVDYAGHGRSSKSSGTLAEDRGSRVKPRRVGTIQLEPGERSQFVFDGIRYLHATYFVRDAQIDGAAYDTERSNLTFLAVNTNSAINETAVRKLVLGNGTPAPQSRSP